MQSLSKALRPQIRLKSSLISPLRKLRHQTPSITRMATPLTMSSPFDSFFNDSFFNSPLSLFNTNDVFTPSLASPRLDIHESKDAWNISVDVPGMNKDEIKVNMKDDMLIISGERTSEKKEGEGKEERVLERSFGTFERRVLLPINELDTSQPPKAKLENGVLTLDFKKKPVEEIENVKKIEIE